MEEIFSNIFLLDKKLLTKNIAPGQNVYGEGIIETEGNEYRTWNPFRSKLAAAIKKGLKEVPIKPGSKVLYLGAASGTTASHVSDIVENKGIVYCVEFSPKVMRELINVCEKRKNTIPIFADARKPVEYRKYIKEKVDCIYEDVAQPDQVRILNLNANEYLKRDGCALIAIKSQSIDVTKKPREVFKEALEEIKKNFEIIQTLELEPFEKDHLFVSLKFKSTP